MDQHEQDEVLRNLLSLMNSIMPSQNNNNSGDNPTSINHLVNNDEDEDRKFLRAAAEAIVATSINNQIDPTILELLKRIQYASAPLSERNSSATTSQSSLSQNPPSSSLASPQPTISGGSQNKVISYLSTDSSISSIRNSSHYPTFDLNYFDNLSNFNTHSNWNFSNHPSTSATSLNELTTNSKDLNSPNSNNLHSDASTNNNSPNDPLLSRDGSINHAKHNSVSSSTEKPFVCEDCSLSFRRSSDLRRHQRAHLPVLPHVCELCGKGFARKDALKRHSDTLTCKRNREKLLSSGGDLERILEKARKSNDS